MYLQRHFLVKCTFLPSSNLLFQVTFQSSFEIQVFCILIWLSRFALLTLDLSSKTAYKKICSIKAVFRNIAIFTVIAIFILLLNRQLPLIIKIKLNYEVFWFWKLFNLQRNKKGWLLSRVYKHLKGIFQTWTFSAELQNCHFFCHYHISLICLIHLSMPNIYFYTIRSITMFLRVINKANCKVLIYYWLTPICETLVAINCSLSERRIIFVPQLLSSPVFRLFYN